MLEIKNRYTRKIDREFNEKLTEGTLVSSDVTGKQTFSINPSNVWKANDYLVIAMTGCTQEELDSLDPQEYEIILEKINKMRQSGSVGEQ